MFNQNYFKICKGGQINKYSKANKLDFTNDKHALSKMKENEDFLYNPIIRFRKTY